MWNLLKKSNNECDMLRDLLEESAGPRPEATRIEELSTEWTPVQSSHFAACGKCQTAAQDLLATRKLFAQVGSSTDIERPWFAGRVMAAIAERERELSEGARTWLAVPKFASRLAMTSAALLLVASAWLYEKPSGTAVKQPTASMSGQEYLFEAPPPPMNQDDVLISMAEQNQ